MSKGGNVFYPHHACLLIMLCLFRLHCGHLFHYCMFVVLEEKGLSMCAVWNKDICKEKEKVAYLGAFAKV